MKNTRNTLLSSLLLVTGLFTGLSTGLLTSAAHAGVVISSTRAIYPSQEREITVKLTNDDKELPRLVQAWIDDGDADKPAEEQDVPFTLTPPIFRMEPSKGQALRIVHINDKSLPTDKETLFWLNVLEIPPKPAEDASKKPQNSLQFAFRTRIKLFYRPKDLKGEVADAPAQLRWKLITEGGERMLEVANPSAYIVSFDKVALMVDGKEIESPAPQLVAPGKTERYPLKELTKIPNAKAEVHFTSIDDYGQKLDKTAVLS